MFTLYPFEPDYFLPYTSPYTSPRNRPHGGSNYFYQPRFQDESYYPPSELYDVDYSPSEIYDVDYSPSEFYDVDTVLDSINQRRRRETMQQQRLQALEEQARRRRRKSEAAEREREYRLAQQEQEQEQRRHSLRNKFGQRGNQTQTQPDEIHIPITTPTRLSESEASVRIVRFIRHSLAKKNTLNILNKLGQLRKIENQLLKLQPADTLKLTFDVGHEKQVLPITPDNKAFISREEAILKKLEQLDLVQTNGIELVRGRRKQIVHLAQQMLDELDGLKEKHWKEFINKGENKSMDVSNPNELMEEASDNSTEVGVVTKTTSQPSSDKDVSKADEMLSTEEIPNETMEIDDILETSNRIRDGVIKSPIDIELSDDTETTQ